MTVTEQGCAELAERLRKASVRTRYGRRPSWVSRSQEDADLFAEAATILSRLTVEELAGVISKTVFTFPDMPESMKASRHIATALLDHITAETEVKANG